MIRIVGALATLSTISGMGIAVWVLSVARVLGVI